jgi:hypothetical protein
MSNGKYLVPVILLTSGILFTVAGLALIVAQGAKAPIAALALLLMGVLDGVAGSAWTIAMLFSRRPEAAPDAQAQAREEARQRFVLAGGLLAVIFLGAILAVLLYLHVIVGCLRSWHLL